MTTHAHKAGELGRRRRARAALTRLVPHVRGGRDEVPTVEVPTVTATPKKMHPKDKIRNDGIVRNKMSRAAHQMSVRAQGSSIAARNAVTAGDSSAVSDARLHTWDRHRAMAGQHHREAADAHVMRGDVVMSLLGCELRRLHAGVADQHRVAALHHEEGQHEQGAEQARTAWTLSKRHDKKINKRSR